MCLGTLLVGNKLIKKKRESLYLLPVHLIEALTLPIGVERATMQGPHANM